MRGRRQEGKVWEVGEERTGGWSSKKVGVICLVSQYVQKQEPEMLFDSHLACVAAVSDKVHKENKTASKGGG